MTAVYAKASAASSRIGQLSAGTRVAIFTRDGGWQEILSEKPVLTTIDSISPESAELTVFMNTHLPVSDRLDTLAGKMDGKLDSYATGVDNAGCFRQVVAAH